MGPQNPVGKGVKGATGDKSAPCICKTGRPFQHFLGGLSGKGEKQNGFRINARLHQPGHPIDQSPGLSTASSGYDQNRSVDGHDCL